VSIRSRLIVVRHAPAENPGGVDDAARRLTAPGYRQMQAGAETLAWVLPPPENILTSPLVRAGETAAILARAFGRVRPPVVTSALTPGFDRGRLLSELEPLWGAAPVMIVGHEPDLSGLLGWITAGTSREVVRLGPGTACILELGSGYRGRIEALYPLEALVRLGSGLSRIMA